MQHPNVEACPVGRLKPYARNARTHSPDQIDQIARSIERFGFTNPILVSDDLEIIAGHGRYSAAEQLGLSEVPIIRLSDLTETERRAYVLADNKLAENAGWDKELLSLELGELAELEFDLDLTGFSTSEIDLIFDGGTGSETVPADDRLDSVPEVGSIEPVTRPGDLWLVGKHRLLCGDAKSMDDISTLCLLNLNNLGKETEGLEQPSLLFTDPPYNVPIVGHVSGLGKTQHREFAEASGEMTSDDFTRFLRETLGNAASVLKDGAIAYVCMDWRHTGELLEAGNTVFNELKNLCVWNKSNAGMGSFYRSKHELVFVFKKGSTPHINNFGLGEGGRYRTNVWDYAGANSFGDTRDNDLQMHPTVKPVAMIADAIRDCSNRNDLILDCFGGSGSTLIAAEEAGRRARILEIDPIYCDTILKRYQNCFCIEAKLAETGQPFNEVKAARQSEGHQYGPMKKAAQNCGQAGLQSNTPFQSSEETDPPKTASTST